MNIKALLKITLIFSACFSAVALVLTYASASGIISTRGLAIGLAGLLVASIVAIVLFLSKSRSAPKSTEEPLLNVDSGSRKRRRFAIWVLRVSAVVFVLAFLNGLRQIEVRPLAPRLVGLAANLLITFAIIYAVRQMQRGQK